METEMKCAQCGVPVSFDVELTAEQLAMDWLCDDCAQTDDPPWQMEDDEDEG